MKQRLKTILTTGLLIAAVSLTAGCAAEKTPYEVNDAENYCVSVKYDANGGTFTTNTSVIVDSYDVTSVPTAGGKAQIALIAPDHEARGNDAFTAVNNGYFLAGWYAQRTESKDAAGNVTYTYADMWDFEKDKLEVDVGGTYTSAEPIMTLYAAWVPMFHIEFCDLATGDVLSTYTFDPSTGEELLVPEWDEETGAIEMYEFPERDGYTFEKAYYDAAGKKAVDTASIQHSGYVNYETGTAEDSTMRLYLDWTEGEWYHIYNVDQFVDNANLNGSYVLHADLDFADAIWPTAMMYGNFSGTIEGNGHTLKNIAVTQTNNSKANAGLFGRLTENANLSDVTFENVTFTIQSGTRVAGTTYGLLAGTIAEGAQLTDIVIKDSTLAIDSKCYFGVDDYSIGLVCGYGDAQGIDASGITCKAVGDAPESLKITVDGEAVTVAAAE